jgi:hypothetical protein
MTLRARNISEASTVHDIHQRGGMILSLLCSHFSFRFFPGRPMSKDFRGAPPTLTETPSIIDARALADILGTLYFEENGDARHIAIDG